jgi:hypothetical protein
MGLFLAYLGCMQWKKQHPLTSQLFSLWSPQLSPAVHAKYWYPHFLDLRPCAEIRGQVPFPKVQLIVKGSNFLTALQSFSIAQRGEFFQTFGECLAQDQRLSDKEKIEIVMSCHNELRRMEQSQNFLLGEYEIDLYLSHFWKGLVANSTNHNFLDANLNGLLAPFLFDRLFLTDGNFMVNHNKTPHPDGLARLSEVKREQTHLPEKQGIFGRQKKPKSLEPIEDLLKFCQNAAFVSSASQAIDFLDRIMQSETDPTHAISRNEKKRVLYFLQHFSSLNLKSLLHACYSHLSFQKSIALSCTFYYCFDSLIAEDKYEEIPQLVAAWINHLDKLESFQTSSTKIKEFTSILIAIFAEKFEKLDNFDDYFKLVGLLFDLKTIPKVIQENLIVELKQIAPSKKLSISLPTNPLPKERITALPNDVREFFLDHFKSYLMQSSQSSVKTQIDDSEILLAPISNITIGKKQKSAPYETGLLETNLKKTSELLDAGKIEEAIEIAKTWLVGISPSAIDDDEKHTLAKELQLIFYRFARLNDPRAAELYDFILYTYNQEPIPLADLSFIFTIMIVPLDRYSDPESSSPNIPKAIQIFKTYVAPLFSKHCNRLNSFFLPTYFGEDGFTFNCLNSVLKRFLKIQDLIHNVYDFCVILSSIANIYESQQSSSKKKKSSQTHETGSLTAIIKKDEVEAIFVASMLAYRDKKEMKKWLTGKSYGSVEKILCSVFEIVGDRFLETDSEIFEMLFQFAAFAIDQNRMRKRNIFEMALVYGGIEWHNQTKIFNNLFTKWAWDETTIAKYLHLRIREDKDNLNLQSNEELKYLFLNLRKSFNARTDVSERRIFFKVLGKKLAEEIAMTKENQIEAIKFLYSEFHSLCPMNKRPVLTLEENWQLEIDYYWLHFLQGFAEGSRKRGLENDLLFEFYSKKCYFDVFQVIDILVTRSSCYPKKIEMTDSLLIDEVDAKENKEIQVRENPFGLLPSEMGVSILRFLPFSDIGRFAQASQGCNDLKEILMQEKGTWKRRFCESYDFDDSPWVAMAICMKPTEDRSIEENVLRARVDSLISCLKRNEFDENTKENLLDLLQQTFQTKMVGLDSRLAEACQLYDQHLRNKPFSNLPPSPTFKEVYQIASNLQVTGSLSKAFLYNQRSYQIKFPVRSHLLVLRDIKSSIVDELIKNNQISASERSETIKKMTIHLENGKEAVKDAFCRNNRFHSVRHFVIKIEEKSLSELQERPESSWKVFFSEQFKFHGDSPWLAMAIYTQGLEKIKDEDLKLKIADFNDRFKSLGFDGNSKITLLHLLKQVSETSEKYREELQSKLLEVCNKYDQESHRLNLPPAPTFKEVYQVASNLAKTADYPMHVNYYEHQCYVKIPIREGLIFLQEMKAVIVDELIKKRVIQEGFRKPAEKAMIIRENRRNKEDFVYKPSEFPFPFPKFTVDGLSDFTTY